MTYALLFRGGKLRYETKKLSHHSSSYIVYLTERELARKKAYKKRIFFAENRKIAKNRAHWFKVAIILVALKSEWIKIGRNKEPLFS